MFHAVKPGLSEYKDNPEEVCVSVHHSFSGSRELLTTKTTWIFFGLGSCDARIPLHIFEFLLKERKKDKKK